MPGKNTFVRGLAFGSALAFVLVASCAPVSPPPPGPETLPGLEASLRRGDISALRRGLGHGPGYARQAGQLANTLDPRAWLVAMGATGREHDLSGCVKAMAANDDAALASALGFGDQALQADVLQAGRTVFSRRSGGLDYFESGKAPLDLFDPAIVPAHDDSLLAAEFTYWGDADGRTTRLRVGRRGGAFTNLQATADAALDAPPRARDARRDPTASAAGGAQLRGFNLPELKESHWLGLEARGVTPQGDILLARLGRDAEGWYLVEFTRSTMTQRLEAERDKRLEHVRRLATDLQRAAGRWPGAESYLTLRPTDLCDPSAPDARRGWADHDARPPVGIALLQPAGAKDPAVACKHATAQGARAITREGNLIWLPE